MRLPWSNERQKSSISPKDGYPIQAELRGGWVWRPNGRSYLPHSQRVLLFIPSNSRYTKLKSAVGLLAIVAVRLLQLRTVARSVPDTPANQVVEPELVETVVRLRGGSADRMTADQFW